ncbi:MAG: NADH-quinone oxidoreductase subunit C [Planctomycetota bacterium]
MSPTAAPNLDHPALPGLKEAFPDAGLQATEFRGQTTVVATPDALHDVLRNLKDRPDTPYDYLADVVGVDYLDYPAPRTGGPTGRFGVIYNLVGTGLTGGAEAKRLFVKTLLDPSIPTDGIEDDPALHLPTATDLWPGAEWLEREVFDMLGIRFDGHPDLRRILTWEQFPAHPHRKDYPIQGRGERENYRIVDRDEA